MSIQVFSATQATATPPLTPIARVGRTVVAAGARRCVALGGRTALLYVYFGVLSVGANGPAGARALPGELVRANGLDAFEFANASRTEALVVYEIEFTGGSDAMPAGVQQRYFTDDEKGNALCRVASEEGDKVALALGHDASLYLATLGRYDTVLHSAHEGHAVWLVLLAGDLSVNDTTLETGDAASISSPNELRISGGGRAEVLLLEAPASQPT